MFSRAHRGHEDSSQPFFQMSRNDALRDIPKNDCDGD